MAIVCGEADMPAILAVPGWREDVCHRNGFGFCVSLSDLKKTRKSQSELVTDADIELLVTATVACLGRVNKGVLVVDAHVRRIQIGALGQ